MSEVMGRRVSTTVRLLRQLKAGPATVVQLASATGISVKAVDQSLRHLRRSGRVIAFDRVASTTHVAVKIKRWTLASQQASATGRIETLRINATESLQIQDSGEGFQQVSVVGDQPGYVVGIGCDRASALASAQATLQGVLNIVDVAIVRGDRA